LEKSLARVNHVRHERYAQPPIQSGRLSWCNDCARRLGLVVGNALSQDLSGR
jgi:hypothetical protein